VPSGLISTLVLAAMLVITTIVFINMRIVALVGAVLRDALVTVVLSDTDGYRRRCRAGYPGTLRAPATGLLRVPGCLSMRPSSFRPPGVAVDLDGGSSHGQSPSDIASHEIPGVDVRPRADGLFWGGAGSRTRLVDEWSGRVGRSVGRKRPFDAVWPMPSTLSRCVSWRLPSGLTWHRREPKLFS
jgi:hypothetical protein